MDVLEGWFHMFNGEIFSVLKSSTSLEANRGPVLNLQKWDVEILNLHCTFNENVLVK